MHIKVSIEENKSCAYCPGSRRLNPPSDRAVLEEPKNPIDSKKSADESRAFAYHMSSMFYTSNRSNEPTL